jgi:inhibitor of KinA sporulation pathway (predicted exonuclease)
MALSSPHVYDYLAVLDFEATCWEDENDHEIIEFPTVIIDLRANPVRVIDEFRVFVKPKRQPILSTFCKQLTGITQDQVDSGVSFPQALKMHGTFMDKYHNSMIVTCGDWDLNLMLPMDLENHQITQTPSIYKKWINIKPPFMTMNPKLKKAMGMSGMLNISGLVLEGHHHSGLDDSRNIARIALKMLKDGWVPVQTSY